LLSSLPALESLELTGKLIPFEWVEDFPPKLKELKLRCAPLALRHIAARFGHQLKYLNLAGAIFGNPETVATLGDFQELETLILAQTDVDSLEVRPVKPIFPFHTHRWSCLVTFPEPFGV